MYQIPTLLMIAFKSHTNYLTPLSIKENKSEENSLHDFIVCLYTNANIINKDWGFQISQYFKFKPPKKIVESFYL